MYTLMQRLFPLNRSLTGKGTLETLKIIQKILPKLKIKSIKSGIKVFDWVVPKEWNVEEAYIKYNEKKIIDFENNNLHLVSYSIPIKKKLTFNMLKKKIYYLKNQPDAIPYVTSYYTKDWGFCLTYKNYLKLNRKGKYKVFINSSLKRGKLNYGEILIKGKSDKEVFLNTYVCHPSMANNELSGPCILTYLIKWIQKRENKYSYRILFAPETIGAIVNIKRNKKKLKKVIAAFNFNCLGGPGNFSILESRNGNTYSDNLIKNVLFKNNIKFKTHNWLERGSDERQYCWPGINLPMVSLMKSKYHDYPEYHTSKDNLRFVRKENLQKSLNLYKKIINQLEKDVFPISTTIGEPNLGKRGLYNTLGIKNNKFKFSKIILNILSLSDGKKSIFQISNQLKLEEKLLNKVIKNLRKRKVLKISSFINS